MGVLGRRSRIGDTADVAATRLRRGAHDVLDAVTGAVSDAAEDLGDRVGTQVTAARRDLADRIDPAPVPRRGLRLLILGLVVTTVSAVIWGVLARRPLPSAAHGGPEHVPPTGADDLGDLGDLGDVDEVVAVEVVEVDVVDDADPLGDEPPASGLTGDPESRSR